jgi:dUTP pyrophosphatase
MPILNVKIKKIHPEAVTPTYAKEGDAGLDLRAVTEKLHLSKTGPLVEYGTGVSVEIPKGYVGLIFSRSSLQLNTSLILGNGVGVIDSGYRGEIKFFYRNISPTGGIKYNVGDKIGQLIIIPYPEINFIETDDLSTSERGKDGFGSTDSN